MSDKILRGHVEKLHRFYDEKREGVWESLELVESRMGDNEDERRMTDEWHMLNESLLYYGGMALAYERVLRLMDGDPTALPEEKKEI